ncbi:hypothetical protein P153DRAFT_350725 [Dothidotthia symphoricarpi CBS 119687]|uniref:Uncharacterized protein n=1 Tax=Dothidotthia symphoricarpi CBS 119687 TaxID=1392245 RepID=A0A6A6A086_9PLEO|nr:uncharacterized protein P153DRAFT_350725 [Dothidotthia symphoricarpi CBS 119687]KAF2124563.1 hypothetical protein P153DRAFT_350725 [Dothidotthia symphoricarpi CBS 119687]
MVGLEELTVAQVSGMIAAAVFVFQILVPIALPIILLGLLRPRSAAVTLTAVSWSVIARFLHSSIWPLILQTDSAATLSACRSALFMSVFKTFILVLIGVAAIVTPLGLHEGIVANGETEVSMFHYMKDASPIGYGTPPRTNATWSRLCGAFLVIPCPNDFNTNTTVIRNDFGSVTVDYGNNQYSSKVSQTVIEAFQSGRANFEDSVSSTFDIQYRNYVNDIIYDEGKGPWLDNDKPRTVGRYQPLSSLILIDDIVPVEGLVVDLKNGGVGFRNHSVPISRDFGSTWDEDLLFVVPETVCVDTNLTIDFSIPLRQSEVLLSTLSGIYRPSITDRGGFININRTYPKWDPLNSQEDVNLWYRAYRGAWFRNIYTMAYMNVTNPRNDSLGVKAFSYLNSEIDKEFPLYYKDGKSPVSFPIEATSLQVSTMFDDYLMGTEGLSNTSTIGNRTIVYNTTSRDPIYANPFGVNSTDWSDIGIQCIGSGRGDLANITNIEANCGILYGAPRREDGSLSLLFDPGSRWTVPMYSCISTAKAIIKTTSFRFNGSNKLSDLEIVSITDKVYLNNESKPLWGVENTNMSIRDGGALWGLVSPESAAQLKLSTVRKESLYLPRRNAVMGFQNMPGLDFASLALEMTYETGFHSTNPVDYSGKSNLAMYQRWQELSRKPETSAQILNLIWTNIAANMVLGTRGLHNEDASKKKRDGTSKNDAKRPTVTMYTRRVKYRYVYGIPAFLALFLLAVTTVSTIFFMFFGSGRPSNMRTFLQHTSAGRFLTSQASGTAQHDEYSNLSTKSWVKGAGKQQFTLGAEGWTKSVQDQVAGYEGKGGSEATYTPVSERDDYQD